MVKYLRIITVALLVTGILFSCKKDSTSAKSDCRIIASSRTGYDQVNFSYNSEGKLSSVSWGPNTTYLVYSGNTILASPSATGVAYYKNIITLNSNGLASDVRTETTNSTGPSTWDNSAYEYSGSELIKATQTSSGIGGRDITTYTWSGGNLITVASITGSVTYSYYTDKPAQGDYLFISELQQGYSLIRNKNALKSLSSGSLILNFAYTYDADGKVTSITQTGSSSTTYTYQYQCN